VNTFEHHDGNTDWMSDASCKDEDPESFFPVGEQDVRITEAKIVCGRCAVKAECLDYAIYTDSAFGIWGGTTEAERRRIKIIRNRNRVA
jgi:WhiB family transcriptional regulator, redox-sensing transcriptional regulator